MEEANAEAADRAERLSMYTKAGLHGLADYSYTLLDIGRGDISMYVYYPNSGFPQCSTYTELSSQQFTMHYAGHRLILNYTSLVCDVATEPGKYTAQQLWETAKATLAYLSSNFCSEGWEGSTDIAEALSKDSNTAYGTFFKPPAGSGFCLLHGTGHSATGCKKLLALQEKYRGEEWQTSANLKLRWALWESTICNPVGLKKQAPNRAGGGAREVQQGHRQGAAAVPATPGKRAGIPLNQTLAKRLQPPAAAAVAAAVPAATAFTGGFLAPQQQQPAFHSSVPAAAAPEPAPTALDKDLLSFVVKHSTEEGKRTSLQLVESLKLQADLRAQNAALNSVLREQDAKLKKRNAELNVYRTQCTCCAREKAAKVRNAAD
jgi:hypothetical protein